MAVYSGTCSRWDTHGGVPQWHLQSLWDAHGGVLVVARATGNVHGGAIGLARVFDDKWQNLDPRRRLAIEWTTQL